MEMKLKSPSNFRLLSLSRSLMTAAPGFPKEGMYVSLKASDPKKAKLYIKGGNTTLHTMNKSGFLTVLVLN